MRHVSQVAQVREMSQHLQVAQRRADPSSGEIAPSTYLKTRVASLSLTAPSSLCSLCVSDCHALYVLALQSVVPLLAIHFYAPFSEECLHHDLHVFSRSSRNTCGSRSREGAIGSLATRCSVRFCPACRIGPRRGSAEGVPVGPSKSIGLVPCKSA